VIANDGTVTRPDATASDEDVTMSYEVKRGSTVLVSGSVDYTVLKQTAAATLLFHFNFESTTKNTSGYAAGTFSIPNLVTSTTFQAPANEVQHTTSANAPHSTQGRFLVMRAKNSDSYIEFDFGVTITQITFNVAIWSAADFGRISQQVSLTLEVWNSTTSTWDIVVDFLPVITNSTSYFTINAEGLTGSKYRLYGVQSGTGDVRFCIDDFQALG